MNSACTGALCKASGGTGRFADKTLPRDTQFCHSDVLRAFRQAIYVLDRDVVRITHQALRPKTVGVVWTADEEAELVRTSNSDLVHEQIAKERGITFEGRLNSLGVIIPVRRTTITLGAAGSGKQRVGRIPSGTKRRRT